MSRLRVLQWLGWCVLLVSVVPFLGYHNRDSRFLKLIGYDRASVLKRFTPQADESDAKEYVDLLRQNRAYELENHFDPSIRSTETADKLSEMAAMFPSGEPSSIKLVDAGIERGPDSVTTNIVLEYEFAPSWLLAQVAIQDHGGVRTITGFHVTPIAESLEQANEFTFKGKGVSQYLGFCLAIAVSLFTLYVFILCVRATAGIKRFAWLVFILTGVCRLSLNWTTGLWNFFPMSLQVPTVRMSSALYGPWLLNISLPLGAIAFWVLDERSASRLASGTVPSLHKEQGAGT